MRKISDGKIDRKELLAFLEYVAGSFEVGIPILDSLDDVVTRLQSKLLRKIILEVRYAVAEEGKSMSAAMGEHPSHSRSCASGRFAPVRRAVSWLCAPPASWTTWTGRSRSRRNSQATMYPIIVVVAVILLVIGLIGFVFPRILPLLATQKELPVPTRVILFLSNFIRTKWLLALITVNAIIMAVYFLRRTERGRLFFDRLNLRLPIFGPVILDVNMARVVTYLSLFYRTGVDLVMSLTIVERIISSKAVAAAIANAREQVTQGVSLAAGLGQSKLFPRSSCARWLSARRPEISTRPLGADEGVLQP